MKLNEYQKLTEETALYNKDYGLAYTVLGLTGEAGEVANEVKRAYRMPAKKVDFHKVMDELGDTLWYLARATAEAGFTLQQVADFNLEKLRKRHT